MKESYTKYLEILNANRDFDCTMIAEAPKTPLVKQIENNPAFKYKPHILKDVAKYNTQLQIRNFLLSFNQTHNDTNNTQNMTTNKNNNNNEEVY